MNRRLTARLLPLLLLGSAACTTKPAMARVTASPAPASVAQAPQPVSVEDTRLLVRRAAMDVVVEDVARATARAQAIIVGSNGYVERDQRSDRSASFTLRVPERSLDAVLDSLATLGSVASRTVSAEDVTEQSIDLDARLQSLIATRDRLRQLHEKATTVAEVIAVEHELARVEGEVDSLEGRLKHLRSSAALATIELRIRRKIVLGPLGVIAQGLGTLISKLFVWR